MSLNALPPLPPLSTQATTASAAVRARQPEQATGGLTDEERRTVAELQKRDREVRAHEMAHLAAGAGVTRGGASYSYQRGPDGRLYAVGGEVGIDTSRGRSPEETIDRARQIRAAALAPAQPSSQDMKVAAAASQMEMQARLELAAQQRAQGSAEENADAATAPAQALARRLIEALEPARTGGVLNTYA